MFYKRISFIHKLNVSCELPILTLVFLKVVISVKKDNSKILQLYKKKKNVEIFVVLNSSTIL